ncbi:hypothetical protein FRC10_001826 [Ceratobasidium sp. 414]|nr:hypothetical protein FRC10_001826 [Ceratobasidium sp. 414]
MATFRPFGQLDYQPLQIGPPQLQFNQFPAPQQQQPPPSRSPHPALPQGYQPQQPQPITHTPRAVGYSSTDPFEWILSNITTLVHTQHLEVTTKLDELVSQQNALSTKVDTLQQAKNSRQHDITSINSSLQTIKAEVARLGADMASRDAMLAARLAALDDAIDPDGRLLSAGGVEPETLQTPPASDAQPTSAQQPEQELQPAVPAPKAARESPENTNVCVGDQIPAPVTGSSSSLSSPGPSRGSPPHVEGNNAAPAPPKITSNPLERVKQQEAGTDSPVRRSNRPPKKRKPVDILTSVPASSKKRKSTTDDIAAKTPAKKKLIVKKLAGPKFDWSTVPFRQERDLQDPLIQCESCDIWYHWACVNINPEDPILRDEETPWACPPCIFEAAQTDAPKARTRGSARTRCRPDCVNADEPEEKFMIESVVGRFPHLPDKTGKTMLYLIKWEDYGLAAATWTPETEIGHSGSVLIQKFEAVAREEGHNISDRQALILLNEASDAGWGYNQAPPG